MSYPILDSSMNGPGVHANGGNEINSGRSDPSTVNLPASESQITPPNPVSRRHDTFGKSIAERSRRRIQEAAKSNQSAQRTVVESQATSDCPDPITTPATPAKLTKEQGIKEVKNVMTLEKTGEIGAFYLMPYCDWQNEVSGGTRPASATRKLDGFLIMCPANTLEDTGIVVCKHYTSSCSIERAVYCYLPSNGGTSSFEKHSKMHGAVPNSVKLAQIGTKSKTYIAKSAAMAVISSNLPFNFAESEGLRIFAEAIFKTGQQSAPGVRFDMKECLPSSTAVVNAVADLAAQARLDFVDNQKQLAMSIGGGVTTDGLKEKKSGRKFYDISILYFSIIPPRTIGQRPSLTMRSRILLLEEHFGAEDAVSIKQTLSGALKQKYPGLSIDKLSERFSFVTDRASTMPCVVGASASNNVHAFGDRWVWCEPHYLNTLMKTVMEGTDWGAKGPFPQRQHDACMARIMSDLKNAKALVRVFKQGGWNAQLPANTNLIQEVTTRFATTHAVSERFAKVCSEVYDVVTKLHSDHKAGNKYIEDMLVQKCATTDKVLDFPCISAIAVVFDSIVSVQKALEADTSPTLHLVLPYLDKIKKILEAIEADSASSEYERALSTSTLKEMQKMNIHPMHAAATILVPSLRNLSFISDISQRERLRVAGEKQIRILMQGTKAREAQKETPTADVEVDGPISASAIPPSSTTTSGSGGTKRTSAPGALQSRTKKRKVTNFFSLAEEEDRPAAPIVVELDELDVYFQNEDLVNEFRAEYDLDDPFSGPLFWLHRMVKFPELSEVALRIFAVPASSTTSERAFSQVARTVTPERATMVSKNIENVLIAKSAIANSVYLAANKL